MMALHAESLAPRLVGSATGPRVTGAGDTLPRFLCVLGIDPGISGGIAFYFPDHPSGCIAEDIPTAAGEVDVDTLVRRIKQIGPDIAVIERVGAMPKQGVSSMFRFGQAYGALRAATAALGIPTHLVAPTVWKRHWRLSADKEEGRALALRLWPGLGHFARKKDHGRAEAALIARYGAEALTNGGTG